MSPQALVTISASYGAGGSRVGPLLAARLDVTFAERVMLRHVADRVAAPLATAHDEQHHVGRSLRTHPAPGHRRATTPRPDR